MIHRSIRGLVKKEHGRKCCCCFSCPAGNDWKKIPISLGAKARGFDANMKKKTVEERQGDKLAWLAKAVVDKTIDTIIKTLQSKGLSIYDAGGNHRLNMTEKPWTKHWDVVWK